MRRPIIAGNWKMNTTPLEAAELARALLREIQGVATVEKVLCPPFVALAVVEPLLEGTDIELGAQNMHWEDSGAFTGEISPPMLVELCQYVILGHSERRQYFGETDENVGKKVKAALAHGLTPIVCVGETLAEHDSGHTPEVVTRQLRAAYSEVKAEGAMHTVVAYEPVWAIGTGRPATAQIAQHVCGDVIRLLLRELYGARVADEIRIQYGGSVTGVNAAELMSQPDIDGALVGGASLKPNVFGAIVRAAAGHSH